MPAYSDLDSADTFTFEFIEDLVSFVTKNNDNSVIFVDPTQNS